MWKPIFWLVLLAWTASTILAQQKPPVAPVRDVADDYYGTVSVVSPVPEQVQESYGVRAVFFYVEVTTARLNEIAELFDTGKLVTDVGTVLPLEEARAAHEMLEGAPHKRGKIVLRMAA